MINNNNNIMIMIIITTLTIIIIIERKQTKTRILGDWVKESLLWSNISESAQYQLKGKVDVLQIYIRTSEKQQQIG